MQQLVAKTRDFPAGKGGGRGRPKPTKEKTGGNLGQMDSDYNSPGYFYVPAINVGNPRE